MKVIDNMRTGFARSSILMKIIWVNIGIFVTLRLIAIASVFSVSPGLLDTAMSMVELPSSPYTLLSRPWTVATYMFAQYDLLHIVFNMLWLYWFGTMFRMAATPRQMFALYLYGGLAGAALFLIGYNTIPLFHGSYGTLIGSSASVMAIVTAVAILMPDFKMYLFLIGGISVKWIAIATIVLVLIGVTGSNAGGEIAHIGGILSGIIFATQLKKGIDITAPTNRLLDAIATCGSQLRHSISNFRKAKAATGQSSGASALRHESSGVTDRNGELSRDESQELDTILDKIKKSGYSALTTEERDRLFNVSRKIK